MKILNIYFKNINSLEGENRIDFEQPPFSDTGVFAITGPNGSGKSSILDAITLALYGETFRFDKPAQHVMTKHTAECFSTLEFTVGSDKYRSSWSVQRAGGNPGGHVLPSEMKLIRLNFGEETIATTPFDVCARIAGITGMNFRSFTRSILLAQGDFAAFLNALDNERIDILEKIVGADIYEDYKKEATDKLAEAQKNLTYLHQDLAAVPLITPESLEACEYDLHDFNELIADYQGEIKGLEQQLSANKETAAARERIDLLETKLQEAISQRITVQKKLEQLAESDKALEFKDLIADADNQKREIQVETASLNTLRNELKQLESTLALPDFNPESPPVREKLARADEMDFDAQKQNIDSLRSQVSLVNANWQSEIILQKSLAEQLAGKQTELAEVTAWLEERPNDQVLLENFPDLDKLKNLRLTLDELEIKRKSLTRWSNSTSAALEKNKLGIDNKNKSVAQLERKLADIEKESEEIAQGYTIEQIEEFQAEQKDRVKDFQELVNLAQAYENLSPQRSFFDRLLGKPEEPVRHADELEQEFASLKEQQKREENIRIALERAVFNDALIARMAHDRNHLIDGKPCPLCGATEHPYSKFPPTPANSQQALNDQRIKIKRLSVGIRELEDLVVFSKKRAEKNQANFDRLQQIKGRWLSLSNKLNVASVEFDIHKTGHIKRTLKQESIELKNIAVLLNNYKTAQKKAVKLKTAIEKTKADILKLQSAVNTIELEWQAEPKLVSEHEADNTKIATEEQELTSVITEQLNLLGEKLPAKGKEDELLIKLHSRRQDFQAYYDRAENLKNEVDILMSKQSAGQTQINSYNDRLAEFNNQLRVEEAVGLHLALIEKQKLIADKENQIRQLVVKAENSEQTLASKIESSPFTGLDKITGILALVEELPVLSTRKAELDSDVENFSRELDKLAIQLETYVETEQPALSIEDIDLKIKSAQEKMTISSLEAQRLETIIREQQQLRQKYESISLQLNKQQVLVDEANAEVSALSADHGLTLRRRVQDKLVEKLLSQTNAILEKISGRYYLRQIASERGLALEIEDTYQGNVRRMPKTLSGGESFIVSLALALGLSELASQGRSVDSLFLDEGFGALDAETLFTVINTLESLRAHGKLVGVISHVEAVQKRFKAQLQLVKKPNGLGELRKVS